MSSSKLNILVLNYEFPPLGGGASPVSCEIARQYVQQGHGVTVVTMHYQGLARHENIDGIDVYRVPAIRSRKELCKTHEMLTYLVSAWWFLRGHLRSTRYDVCHTHFAIPTGPLAVWCRKRYGLNYILTSHGSDIPGFNSDRFKLIHSFTAPFLRRILKQACLITTPSQYLKDLIAKNVDPLLEANTVVLPNGSRDMYREGYRKKNIIFSSGRLLQRKGFDLLIEAFNSIDHEDWQLYIVGDGPYAEHLRELAGENDSIVFTGWLDNSGEQYLRIANEARIFSLLSESESQGIVFLEAMSAGCAILSSDTTACRETVLSDVGLLVSRDDAAAIADALSEIMHAERIDGYMRNARDRYERLYQYDAVGLEYQQLLKSCIS